MRDSWHLRLPASGKVPPFWIQTDERAGRSLNPDVRAASLDLWPWAYRYVSSVLRDPPRAAELLEDVALEVSKRLQVKPEVSRNLKGYVIAAFHHRVGLELIRSGRITYEGLMHDLEGKHRLFARDWLLPTEMKICVREIIALMPAEARRVVHYRLLNYTWVEIAEAMHILVPQARNKYYYGIKAATERLFTGVGELAHRGDHRHDPETE
jgi:DNA-directed RNA polymerase specialized sigma24 family protein